MIFKLNAKIVQRLYYYKDNFFFGKHKKADIKSELSNRFDIPGIVLARIRKS